MPSNYMSIKDLRSSCLTVMNMGKPALISGFFRRVQERILKRDTVNMSSVENLTLIALAELTLERKPLIHPARKIIGVYLSLCVHKEEKLLLLIMVFKHMKDLICQKNPIYVSTVGKPTLASLHLVYIKDVTKWGKGMYVSSVGKSSFITVPVSDIEEFILGRNPICVSSVGKRSLITVHFVDIR